MTDTPRTIVIVGGGLAGATAAATLREEGFDGRVVLLGEEPDRPYERPPLSKEFLRGDEGATVPYVHDERFYAEHDIDLRTSTRAVALNVADNEVELGDGPRLRFDLLLLTTGMRPRKLRLPGTDLDGVHYLRRLGDSRRLHEALTGGPDVVVVGGGWIGSEVAASAAELGSRVTVVAPESVPLERVLGLEVGGIYARLHAEHGTDLRMSAGVEAVLGEGRVSGVRLADGTAVPADVVVIGAGAVIRDELARDAGLEIADGVVTDEHLRTSADGIFAAGDIAAAAHPLLGERIRVEHWANAKDQGAAAARSMLGDRSGYTKVPYFYSDQFDLGMEYRGHATGWDRVVLRGDVQGREFLAFWLSGGRVVAGMNANVWDQGDAIEALVGARAAVDPDRLSDIDVPLTELLPAP